MTVLEMAGWIVLWILAVPGTLLLVGLISDLLGWD